MWAGCTATGSMCYFQYIFYTSRYSSVLIKQILTHSLVSHCAIIFFMFGLLLNSVCAKERLTVHVRGLVCVFVGLHVNMWVRMGVCVCVRGRDMGGGAFDMRDPPAAFISHLFLCGISHTANDMMWHTVRGDRLNPECFIDRTHLKKGNRYTSWNEH